MYLRHQCDTPLQGIFEKPVNQLCWTGQDDHCQFFLYQILRGMKYVHSAQARLMCWGRVAACRLAKAKIQVSTAPSFVGKTEAMGSSERLC